MVFICRSFGFRPTLLAAERSKPCLDFKMALPLARFTMGCLPRMAPVGVPANYRREELEMLSSRLKGRPGSTEYPASVCSAVIRRRWPAEEGFSALLFGTVTTEEVRELRPYSRPIPLIRSLRAVTTTPMNRCIRTLDVLIEFWRRAVWVFCEMRSTFLQSMKGPTKICRLCQSPRVRKKTLGWSPSVLEVAAQPSLSKQPEQPEKMIGGLEHDLWCSAESPLGHSGRSPHVNS